MKFNTITLLLCFVASIVHGQNSETLTQKIRGKIVDQDSEFPLFGVNVVVLGSDPFNGASSDVDGNYELQAVPVGRVDLQFTSLGYEPRVIHNVVVGSAKEVIMNISMQEMILEMEGVEISAQASSTEQLNEMALSSARQFSAEETQRYAGGFNDPARMVSAFAGVTADAAGNNDIVVRGNSPKGIQWRLEGVEIPNPNHFADEGASGGSIGALNSDVMANSDFLTSAFPAEYGNAYSGIFDINLRTGNNQQREYAFGVGVLGTDLTLEGPFKKGGNASYLFNYRYSTLDALVSMGLFDWGGVPKYQDAAMKIVLPTEKAGSFTAFGIGGMSGIHEIYYTDETETTVDEDGSYNTNFGVIGLKHVIRLNDQAYLTSTLSKSASGVITDWNETLADNQLEKTFEERLISSDDRLQSVLNYKFNARHHIRTGVILTRKTYQMNMSSWLDSIAALQPEIDDDGEAFQAQGYASWKYRASEQLTFTTGLHSSYFSLNEQLTVEPRLGMQWTVAPNHWITAGAGMHSKNEPLSSMLADIWVDGENRGQLNKNVQAMQARHYVVGYGHQINPKITAKAEIYYQDLYNVPISADSTSKSSSINGTAGYNTSELVNDGRGRNYGIEATVERTFSDRYYFLLTASVFQSEYTAHGNEWFNTRYNNGFSTNLLLGKEFQLGDPAKARTLTVNAKVNYLGGRPRYQLDREASISSGESVWDLNTPFSDQSKNIFRTDLTVSLRRDRKKTTSEVEIEVMNVTNAQTTLVEWYNATSGTFEGETQMPIVPNIMYRIYF